MFRILRPTAIMLLMALCLAACQPQRPTATPSALPSASPASPTPTLPPPPSATPPATATTAPYPPPTPARAVAPTPYPEPLEVEAAPGRAIAILALQPQADSVRLSGSASLPNEACIQTWLYANGKLVSWWPTEQCANLRAGAWTLSIQRPALSPQEPPGARYTVIAKSLAHPEAGEARLVMTAFIPYHGGGN